MLEGITYYAEYAGDRVIRYWLELHDKLLVAFPNDKEFHYETRGSIKDLEGNPEYELGDVVKLEAEDIVDLFSTRNIS